MPSSVRHEAVEIGLTKHITRIAELAGHSGNPLFTHILDFLVWKSAQNSLDPFARAPAARFDRMRVINPDSFLVE